MKSMVPVVMAGIVAIYGMVVSVLIVGQLEPEAVASGSYTLHKAGNKDNKDWVDTRRVRSGSSMVYYCVDADVVECCLQGFVHLGAGLSVGLSGLAAGYAIGIAGEAGVRGTAQQPRLFVGMILILIFAEVLGLYGLIIAIFMYSKNSK